MYDFVDVRNEFMVKFDFHTIMRKSLAEDHGYFMTTIWQ